MFLTALFSSMDKLSLNAKKDSIIDIQSKKSNKQQVNIGVDSSGIKQVESARLLAVHIEVMFAAKLQNFLVYFVEEDIYLPRVVIRSLYDALIYPYLS